MGSWKDAGDVLINTESDGEKVTMTGTGGSIVVNADGSATQQLGPETLTGTDSSGNTWTEVLTGSATLRLVTSGGTFQSTDVNMSSDATYTLYENGILNSTGPASLATAPGSYTCTSTTWHQSGTDSSSVYDRVG